MCAHVGVLSSRFLHFRAVMWVSHECPHHSVSGFAVGRAKMWGQDLLFGSSSLKSDVEPA